MTIKSKVMDGCPWSFDNKMLLLKEITGDEQPSKVTFTKCQFRIRLSGVPFSLRNAAFAHVVGECLGGVLANLIIVIYWDRMNIQQLK